MFLLLTLARAFLTAGALSVDMSSLWFHRQTAQNAADSSYVAGAMDLLVDAQSGATGHQGFTNSTAFSCMDLNPAGILQPRESYTTQVMDSSIPKLGPAGSHGVSTWRHRQCNGSRGPRN